MRLTTRRTLLILLALLIGSLTATRATAQDEATPSMEATPGAESEVVPTLPPPDLPASNPQGYTFNLTATLSADPASAITEAPIYELVPTTRSREEVAALADRLQLDGEVEDRGNGIFAVSGNGDLVVAPGTVEYLSPVAPEDEPLPTDEEAIAFGREWLRLTNLLPPDLGDGRVVSRAEETGHVVVLFGPSEPQPLLAAYPSISVSLGPGGSILGASVRWATITRGDLYLLRPADDAWSRVESGEAYLEAELDPAVFQPGSEINGTVEYIEIGIAYTTAGPPDGQQYLEPIYVFTGTLSPEGQDQTYPVKAYVAALANIDVPVGDHTDGGPTA